MTRHKNGSGMEAEVELCPYGTYSGRVRPGTQSAEQQWYDQALAYWVFQSKQHSYNNLKKNMSSVPYIFTAKNGKLYIWFCVQLLMFWPRCGASWGSGQSWGWWTWQWWVEVTDLWPQWPGRSSGPEPPPYTNWPAGQSALTQTQKVHVNLQILK